MDGKIETIITSLHYLFSHSEGRVVAHCLDLDLVTSGDNIKAAEERLNAVVLAQIAFCATGGNFDQLRFKAPSEYWENMASARQLDKSRLEVEIPPVVLPVKRAAVQLAVWRCETEPVYAAASV